MASEVFSLYRSFLREIRHLPDHYLRQFYRFKVQDDIRAILQTSRWRPKLKHQKIKRVEKSLRRLQSATSGDVKNFNHVLALAYGRKGRIRRELLEPLIHDPATPLPPRMISEVPRSRPPVYPPAYSALVTSEYSRSSSSSLRPSALQTPPTLPLRANPSSPQAKYFGPFSKRREVNIRWRFFTKQYKRVLPPLELNMKTPSISVDSEVASPHSYYGLKDAKVLESIEHLVGNASPSRNLTRREKLSGKAGSIHPILPERNPSRWLRRRYQHILAQIPQFEFNLNTQKYSVSLHPKGFLPSAGGHVTPPRLVEIDSEDRKWLELDQTRKKPQT